MEQYVVTITRQFGSLGRPIAQKMSEILEIKYFDRDIVEATAKQTGLAVSTISDQEENAKTPFFRMKFPLGNDAVDIQNKIFNVQKTLIWEIADKQSCIIVGRCSDYILRNFKNHISVYIYAPFEERLDNCIHTLGIPKEKAISMIHEVDKSRRAYHKKYTKYYPEDIQYKDIMINSSLLGVDGTAEMLSDVIQKRFGV